MKKKCLNAYKNGYIALKKYTFDSFRENLVECMLVNNATMQVAALF